MKEIQCRHCEKTVPMNESFTALGDQTCLACTEALVESNSDLEENSIKPNRDPTVCITCNSDGGSRDLDKIMGYPVCLRCAPDFKNHPFPLWIKIGALGLAVLVVLSFGLNVRFVKANNDLEAYWLAMESGDFQEAVELSEAAAKRVPEVLDIKYLNSYSAGLVFMGQDMPREALAKFNECKGVFSEDFGVEEFIWSAQKNIAFDDQNYDLFLSMSREDYEADPDLKFNILMLASALACKYVSTGEDGFRFQAEKLLEEYRASADPEDHSDYEMRIEHRLYTRDIITPQQFTERYPDGWLNPEGDK